MPDLLEASLAMTVTLFKADERPHAVREGMAAVMRRHACVHDSRNR